jgi:hypothetical protein
VNLPAVRAARRVRRCAGLELLTHRSRGAPARRQTTVFVVIRIDGVQRVANGVLGGVHIEQLRQFGLRPLTLDRPHPHIRSERGRVSPPGSLRHLPGPFVDLIAGSAQNVPLIRLSEFARPSSFIHHLDFASRYLAAFA